LFSSVSSTVSTFLVASSAACFSIHISTPAAAIILANDSGPAFSQFFNTSHNSIGKFFNKF
jgi:hypothetical protein